jgi:hypothetical protein
MSEKRQHPKGAFLKIERGEPEPSPLSIFIHQESLERSLALSGVKQKGNHQRDEKYDKENFCNAGRGSSNSRKTQNTGN